MRSLEGRLQLGLAASLVLLIGLAWWLGHAALHHTADAFVKSRLEHDSEGLVGALAISASGERGSGTLGLTPVYAQPYSGHYFVVRFEDGQVTRSRSLWDADLEVPRLAPGETRFWQAPGPDRQRLLVRAGGYRLGDRDLVVAVAEDITPMSTELVLFERLFGLMALAGLMTSLLIQRLIVRRTLARLDLVYEDIERLERGRAVRLTEQVPAEIAPLVRKLNRLLVRLAQRLERSRSATGNLAHALKGPLSLLRQQLEDPALSIDTGARDGLLEQVERLRRIAERQLQRARLAGAGQAGLAFDPEAELPALARLLGRMHSTKGLEIRLQHQTRGMLDLDREDMLELLGNLLDNACKWARARVEAHLTVEDRTLRLRVADDGPGCSEEAIRDITERGLRLDEQVSGHGLGLSIVKEIVDGYAGTLSFGTAPGLGGLLADVRLPLSQDRPDAG